jgi:hypothetical protein
VPENAALPEPASKGPTRGRRRAAGHELPATLPTERAAVDDPTSTGRPEGRATLSVTLTTLLEQLLGEGTSVRFEVTGASMTPFIRSGDVVTLCPRSDGAVRLGDVVGVRRGQHRLLVHRVVGNAGGELSTRGDATPSGDGTVEFESVLGVVTRLERGGKRVRFGLGPERRLIALASRLGLLVKLLGLYGRWKRLQLLCG